MAKRRNRINRVVNPFFSALFRLRRGKLSFRGTPSCILHTIGARSGRPRQTPLLYLDIGNGDYAIVASNGGDDKTPDWVHNLRAHPDVELDLAGGRKPFRARLADDAERAGLWPRVVAMYKAYESYQTKTDRQIPIVVLTPR